MVNKAATIIFSVVLAALGLGLALIFMIRNFALNGTRALGRGFLTPPVRPGAQFYGLTFAHDSQISKKRASEIVGIAINDLYGNLNLRRTRVDSSSTSADKFGYNIRANSVPAVNHLDMQIDDLLDMYEIPGYIRCVNVRKLESFIRNKY